MKLKDLNKIIVEGEYVLYFREDNTQIVYDNESRKKYEEYEVCEIYTIQDIQSYLVIELGGKNETQNKINKDVF